METLEATSKRFAGLDNVVTPGDVIVTLPFDLPADSDKRKVDGIIGVTKEKIKVFVNDAQTAEYIMADVKEFKCVPCIGCTTIELVTESRDILLCRAGMELQLLYATVSKRLNRYIESGVFDADFGDEVNVICPKCRRPYPPGSTVCPHCADKGRYLKRIWEIALPYRKYIFCVGGIFTLSSSHSTCSTPTSTAYWSTTISRPTPCRSFSQFMNRDRHDLWRERHRAVLHDHARADVDRGEQQDRREAPRAGIQQDRDALAQARVQSATSGELINRVTGDTDTLQDFVTYQLGDIAQQTLDFRVDQRDTVRLQLETGADDPAARAFHYGGTSPVLELSRPALPQAVDSRRQDQLDSA